MKRISILDAKPGMVVAQAVFSRNGKRLLNPGVTLSEAYINKLLGFGVPILYIQQPDPLDHLDLYRIYNDVKELPDVINFETRVRAEVAVYNIMKDAKGGQLFNLQPAKESVEGIIDEVLTNHHVITKLADIRILDDYTFAHSVNVCILSIATGVILGYDREKLYELGIGALLHDLGKVFIKPEILNKPTNLTAEEYDEIKKHPQYAYNLLRRHPHIKPVSANIAYQHHERFNGQGYPKGLKYDKVHAYAKIVAIADVYDAMTADRVYKNMIMPYEAIEVLIASAGLEFEPEIVKGFVGNLAIYPIGSVVELNTGERGVVTYINRSLPIRPTIKVTEDGEGKPVTPNREVDLMKSTTVFVKRVLHFRPLSV